MDGTTAGRLRKLVDESDIRDLLYRYCRGIDRRRLAEVAACYHPDAWDDHSSYRGDVAGFLEFCEQNLASFIGTMHFLGNIIIDVDGESARSEAYCVAIHQLPSRPPKHMNERHWIVGLRYLDEWDRRGGRWAISRRVCVFEWTRTDEVRPGWTFPEGYRRGSHENDLVFEFDPGLS